jgi:hypothetical protein
VPHRVGSGGASCSERLADLEATAAATTERVSAARNALERHGGDAALAAQVRANRAVRDFQSKHAADLEDERRSADAARIKDALAGDDGDAIREVLRPSVPQPTSGVFTTRDLPRRTRGI